MGPSVDSLVVLSGISVVLWVCYQAGWSGVGFQTGARGVS